MLNVDEFFYKVLSSNTELMELVHSNIFSSARDKVSEENDTIPYIIVVYEEGKSGTGDKDDRMSPLEGATITIICCTENREQLCDLTYKVWNTLRDAINHFGDWYDPNWHFVINRCQCEPDEVMHDCYKPCYAQQLRFYCDTQERK